MIGLALVALLPVPMIVDRCDMIELNHVFDPSTGNETGIY